MCIRDRPQLNEFIGSCCMDGRFDLEPATRYMSESLGYGALNEENPHTAIRDQIETMAKEANICLLYTSSQGVRRGTEIRQLSDGGPLRGAADPCRGRELRQPPDR